MEFRIVVSAPFYFYFFAKASIYYDESGLALLSLQLMIQPRKISKAGELKFRKKRKEL